MNCIKNGIKIEGASCSYNNNCIYPKCINNMNNEYIIINKTALENRIEELESLSKKDKEGYNLYQIVIVELKQLLSQSTPLIPVIEQAFDAGDNYRYWENNGSRSTPSDVLDKEDHISNLKLDI